MISESSERKIGTILSYASIGVGIIVSLLYTPYMLKTVGKAEFGLYNTLVSMIGMISMIELGFTSSYIKFYAKYEHDHDEKALATFNSLFTIIFLIIGLISLCIGVFFTFHLDLVYKNGLTSREYDEAKTMLLLMTISLALGFITTVFTSFISAKEKFIFLKSFGLATSVLTVALNIICLMGGHGVVGLVFITFIVGVFSKIVYILYAFKAVKIHFDLNLKNIKLSLLKEILSFSGLIAINIFVDKINSSIDSVLLGRFCGTAVVGVYAVGMSISNMNTNFSTAISGIFTPRVHKLVNEYKMDSIEQRQSLTSFFTRIGRVQFILMALIASGYVFFGKRFIYLWAGPGYDESYYVALMLIVPNIVPLIQNVGIEIQRAESRHHYRSYIYGVMAVINLVLTIFLCQRWGAIGAAFGTFLSILIANIIIMNIVYHKKINIDMFVFWKSIISLCRGIIIPIVIGILINKYAIKDCGILWFGVWVIVYSVIYLASMWLFGMNEYEKNVFKSFINSLKNRGKVKAR